MTLALFDLDHTLLDGDTNFLWLHFLAQQRLVADDVLARQITFETLYKERRLDIRAYLQFHVQLLSHQPLAYWLPWRDQFVKTCVAPRISQQAYAAVAAHQRQGHTTAIISATHSFLAENVGALFGIPVISSKVEVAAGCLTGQLQGLPCFGAHKIDCLHQWLGEQGLSADLHSAWFYSDSANDLPLLEWVGHPVVVNADAALQAIAKQRQWPSLQWLAPATL